MSARRPRHGNPQWWVCPNGDCAHGATLHDVEDACDETPRCCVEGCVCGQPVAPEAGPE